MRVLLRWGSSRKVYPSFPSVASNITGPKKRVCKSQRKSTNTFPSIEDETTSLQPTLSTSHPLSFSSQRAIVRVKADIPYRRHRLITPTKMQWVHDVKPGTKSQAPQIIPVCVVLTLVAFFVTALRCYVRAKMIKSFGADDAVILASTVRLPLLHLDSGTPKADYLRRSAVSSTAVSPSNVRAKLSPPTFPPSKSPIDKNFETETRWGLGLPLKDRPRTSADEYGRVNFAGRPFYMLGILGFKVSLCLAYLRLLSAQRTYRRITWTVLVTCALTHLGGILVLMFQCKPVSKNTPPFDYCCYPWC